jgi:DNA repair exonuclease SbcCD ATPase subunit
MILRCIEIENWRCFVGRVRVGPLSHGLNVLYAPNATGKSTLFEGMRRGLLDSYRVTGRDVEALRPWGRSLAPKVTIEFSRGGIEYRFEKGFLDRPFARLERKESNRFVPLAEGEDADSFVRGLLTRNPPGRGLARPENWGLAQVLWAPQGALTLAALSGDLVRDVHQALGAQLGGSEGGPIEQRIELEYARFFTRTGVLKKGKDAPALERLRNELKELEDRRAEAATKHHQYLDAARHVEDLRATREQSRRDARELEVELARVRLEAEKYRQITTEKAGRVETVRSAAARHQELKRRVDAIVSGEADLDRLRVDLRNVEENLPARAREVESCRRASVRAKATLEDVRKERNKLDAARALAEAAARLTETARDLERVEDRLQRIANARADLEARRQERTRLLVPDARALRKIVAAVKRHDELGVQIEAALITVEVVPERELSLTVVAGDEPGTRSLRAGHPEHIKGAPEVSIDFPGLGRLRARGPSGSAEDLRRERKELEGQLRALTAGYGTSDPDELEKLREQARRLDAQVSEAQTRLDTLLGGDELEKIEAERQRAAAVVNEILAEHEDWRAQRPDVEALRATVERLRAEFVPRVEKAEEEWQAAEQTQTAAARQQAAEEARGEQMRKRVADCEAKLGELTADGKEKAERAVELSRIALEWDAAQARLRQSEVELSAFGDDPGKAMERLQRQLSAAAAAAEEALSRQRLEEGRLQELAGAGTYSVLAGIEEKIAALQQEVFEEELRVSAVRLLHDVLVECRSEVLSRVSAPVEAAATRLVRRIAGPRLGRVRLGEGFAPAEVVPETLGEGVGIESASGGESEQIHLATRLALAEVLARDERQLVVLDDVLLATDTGRLARVLDVLEEAAQRLQVLVLTCHPERYRGLGEGTFIDLEAILSASAA